MNSFQARGQHLPFPSFAMPPQRPAPKSDAAKAPEPHRPPLVHWRRTVDIAAVECLSAVIVNVSAIVYANLGFEAPGIFASPWSQLIPALPVGIVMLVCKSEQYMPPDASPTVTILMWLSGAFRSWLEVVARLVGHCAGFGIALLLCKDMNLPPQWYSVPRPGALTFASEAVATTVEHVAVICLLMPLIKSTDTLGPPNPVVLHAAVVLAATHWILRVTFATDMNPSVLVGKAAVATWQIQRLGDAAGVTAADVWNDCLMAVWGVCVGLGLAVAYANALCKQFPGVTAAKPS